MATATIPGLQILKSNIPSCFVNTLALVLRFGGTKLCVTESVQHMPQESSKIQRNETRQRQM